MKPNKQLQLPGDHRKSAGEVKTIITNRIVQGKRRKRWHIEPPI